MSISVSSARAIGPTLPAFNPNSATGVYFNGLFDSTIQVSTGPDFDIGCGDFTVSWWQKASNPQIRYGRLFQFGEGYNNSDAFAVSEEGGSLYLWLNNSVNRTGIASLANISLPDTPTEWNHIAIVRSGRNIYIFLNGVTTGFAAGVGSSICAPTGIGGIATLPLFIGGSNDEGLGAFQGEVTGFEFFKGARWIEPFTPPTQFSTDVCQRLDVSNTCTLTSLLLLYPTEDFKASGRTLNNLITNDVFTVGQAVTYGNGQSPPEPPAPILERTVGLINRAHGIICLLDSINEEFCTGSSDQSVNIPMSAERSVLVEADPGYSIDTVTITSDYAELQTSDFVSSFTFSEDTDANFIFQWDGNLLLLPVNLEAFSVDITFKLMPQPSNFNTSVIPEVYGFNPDSDFSLKSADPLNPINYSTVQSMVLEINYRQNNPTDADLPATPRTCRRTLELGDSFGVSNDLSEMWIDLPPSEIIMGDCSGYHQTNPETQGKIFLLSSTDPTSILQEVPIRIISPPGIHRLLAETIVESGQIVAAEVSNMNFVTQQVISVYSSNPAIFDYGRCSWLNNVRVSPDTFAFESVNEDGNLLFEIPSLIEINERCTDQLAEGIERIGPTELLQIGIGVIDDEYESESEVILTLRSFMPTPEPTPDPTPAPRPTPALQNAPIYIPAPQPLSESIPEPMTTNANQTVPLPPIDVVVPVKEKVLDFTWCTTKGIWIYTVSGKLRLCNPKNNLALEIPACAGKAETPTYPWIFKPQRFIPGTSPSKSGTLLHNAIFFFKGLAISGSTSVSSEPCSKGSVFIPMEYSKVVYSFAKSEKPSIWVKNN